jgi:hypothetical protein
MRLTNKIGSALVTIALVCVHTEVAVGQQSVFDRVIPSDSILRASLDIANALAVKQHLTSAEILQIYFAENIVGRFVWARSQKDAQQFPPPYIGGRYFTPDSGLVNQCVFYVGKNHSRFRPVSDAWKGEEDFTEPNRFWLKQAIALDPNSAEASNIEFDLDFKDLVRDINIDEDARGKTCQQFHDEDLKRHLDSYLDVYQKEEMDRWPAECDSARSSFIRKRDHLLRTYKFAPFTKILQDIDATTIVVFHSVCEAHTNQGKAPSWVDYCTISFSRSTVPAHNKRQTGARTLDRQC